MPPTLRLDQINLVVSDMGATVAFYSRLGLDIPDSEPEFQAHHRSARTPDGIDLDFDSVAFARMWNAGVAATRSGGTIVLGFKAESRADVDAIYSDMTGAGYRGQQAPYDAFWGARYAIIEDPDGNSVGIMSPMDPAMRRRPTPPA